MTVERDDWLTDQLIIYLEGKTVPSRLAGAEKKKPRAQAQEFLERALLREAPRNLQDAEPWLEGVLQTLEESLKHSVWPTTQELVEAIAAWGRKIGAATRNKPTKTPPHSSGAQSSNPEVVPHDWLIHASRIKAGEPVSEHALWGNTAEGMLQAGLVTLEQLNTYRRGLAREAEQVWGKEEAARFLEERQTGRPVLEGSTSAVGRTDIGSLLKRMPETDPSPPYTPNPSLRSERVTGRYGLLDVPIPDPEPREDLELEPDIYPPRAQGGEP